MPISEIISILVHHAIIGSFKSVHYNHADLFAFFLRRGMCLGVARQRGVRRFR